MSELNNYEKFQKAKCDLSMTDIVNAFDFIQALIGFVPEGDELRKAYEYVIEPLNKIVSECSTEARCPHCGRPMFYSDLENYDYVCTECDENFYDCEVE